MKELSREGGRVVQGTRAISLVILTEIFDMARARYATWGTMPNHWDSLEASTDLCFDMKLISADLLPTNISRFLVFSAETPEDTKKHYMGVIQTKRGEHN